ncbi:hypothetical protein QBC33DRAFT_549245 [Phialemonium atrogriseum]|uniref:Uncharacterized protein n=1 Tax=Phialemonium atrogriseum TaxID=1093897 RepID=A0AAJ0BT38_9PEZI|nr:uncharacterized protein QBC33DRAFT_549245 [Phialemonium atrogriseum]KAK1763532.1 hypothetical protein QBC33DRAFT_549245 [Phialemonium atrogriseum]
MPREGTGHSDNAVETGHNIIHGAGEEKLSSHVNRADKAAPLPEHEKGAGLKDVGASGGQSQGLASGPERGQGGRGKQH